VAEILRKAGTTGLLVTHDADEALAVADTIAVLHDGRIAQADAPDILYHRPADVSVARALGEANLVPAELAGTRAVTALGVLPLTNPALHNGPGTVLVRPHQLRVSIPGTDSLAARVTGCRLRGHDYRIELATDLPHSLVAYTTDTPPAIGEAVHLTVHGTVHLLGTASVATLAPCVTYPS
jgi:iron(III) transport system ATP-binding protein